MQTLELLEPADGWVSYPLQKHNLPAQNPDAEDSDAVSGFQWQNLEVVNADRSHPRTVTFSWGKLGGWGINSVSYDLILAQSLDLKQGTILVEKLSKPTVELGLLLLGQKYYWKVVARKKREVIAESRVSSFTTDATAPRWIHVPGITNVRDLGGWPLMNGGRIRQGMVYRSSEMNGRLRLTARGRRVLEDDLGIRTDLDLRGDFDGASPALNAEKVKWINAPISPYDFIMDVTFRDEYLKIFKIFADPESYPILFHCVGGADRGGTVAFLLNALLGKERELLIHDYELTTLSVWGERSRWSQQFKALLEALGGFHEDANNVNAQSENFLKSIGVSDAEIASIRKLLVCTAGSDS